MDYYFVYIFKNSLYIFVFSVFLFLVGCSGDDDERLEGVRIPITLETFSLTADSILAGEDIVLRAAQPNLSWSQSGGLASHAVGHLSYSHEFNLLWQSDIGSGNSASSRLTAEPLVVGNSIYVMDSGYVLSSLDKASGKERWRLQLPRPSRDSDSFGGGVAYYRGKLFISSGWGEVFAVDSESAEILWQYNLVTPIRSSPTVAENVLLVTAIDNLTTAFDSERGVVLWTHQGFQERAGVIGSASAAISERTAVVPYSSGELFGLRLSDGIPLWQSNLSKRVRSGFLADLGDISANPIVAGGAVFAVSHAGRLGAIDVASGAALWDLEASSRETPALSGDYLFYVSSSAQLVAVRAGDGAVKWVRQLPYWAGAENSGAILHWRGPILLSGRLLLTNQRGEALWVSAFDGEVIEEFSLRGAVAVRPAVSSERLYILYSDGILAAYE